MAGSQASFAIDIAARMSGLESTNAELDAITAKLSGAGRGAEHFQTAIRDVTVQLDGAKAATVAANNSLAAGADNFKLAEKEAVQASKGFDKLSAELLKIGAALEAAEAKGDTSAVGKLSSAYAELANDVQLADVRLERANAELKAQATTLGALERNANDAAAAERKLTNTMGNLRKMSAHVDRQLNESADRFSMVRGGVGDLGGAFGSLGDSLTRPVQGFLDLRQSVGMNNAIMLAGVAGAAALVVGIAALTAAVVAGVASIAAWAVKLGDARRSAALTTEALRAMNPELAANEAGFAALERATGLSTDALRGVAAQVDAAKVAASDLPDVLLAASQAEAALGAGGAGKFLDAMNKSKKGAAAFARETQAKLGGVVARQMLSLDKQAASFKKNISSLFGGLNVDPALSGLQTIVGLFDRTSASGAALETLFGKFFQPLIDNAENAGFVVEAFVLGFEIGLMKTYLAARPVLQAVTDLFGFEDLTLEDVCTAVGKAAQVMAVAFTAAAVVFGAILTVVGAVTVAYAAFQGAILAVAVALQGVGLAALYAVGAGFKWLWDQAESVRAGIASAVGGIVETVTAMVDAVVRVLTLGFVGGDWAGMGAGIVNGLTSGVTSLAGALVGAASALVDGVFAALARLPTVVMGAVSSALAAISNVSQWVTVGGQIVAGLASGIASSAGAVVRAITGVTGGAISAAKKMLGIASPSKVFASIGAFTGEGFALGVEGETATAQDAMASLVAPPESPVIAGPVLSVPEPAQSGVFPVPVRSAVAPMPAQSIDLGKPSSRAAAADASASASTVSAPTSSGRSVSINMAGATITFNGVADAPESLQRFAEMLTMVLEGDALAAGAA